MHMIQKIENKLPSFITIPHLFTGWLSPPKNPTPTDKKVFENLKCTSAGAVSRTGLSTNYHRVLQETSPFVTNGPGAGLASPGNTKSLNQLGPSFGSL